VRVLKARDFHQIAGRAGRKGFDTEGFVVALAPEHVVENLRLEAKAQSGKGNKRKFVRKKPPEWGYAHWDQKTFERLVAAEPEALVSRFSVTHGMLLQVLGRQDGACRAMKNLVKDSLETDFRKKQHRRHAIELLRSLWQAGVIEFRSGSEGGGVRVNDELQEDFSLFHALGLYVVDAVERLDRESPTYALDVVTLVESILEDPEVVLRRQVDKLKTEKLAELKAAGVEYDERMAELDKIEHPKPNAEFLHDSLALFRKDHPWVASESLRPKSVARQMAESLQPFGGTIKEYGLQRSEGLLLRYLADAYKTLVQTVPEAARTDELIEIMDYLGALVRGVDSSLLDEWERLRDPTWSSSTESESRTPAAASALDPKRFRALVRNLLFSFLGALQREDYESALALVETGEREYSAQDLERAFKPAVLEGGIRLDAEARSPKNTVIDEGEAFWKVTQNTLIGDDVSEYCVVGRVDLVRSDAERRPIFLLDHAGSGD
jgi:hypothetical protein